MATKPVSSAAKTVKRKPKAAVAPELTGGAVVAVLESQTASTHGVQPGIDPDERRQMVAKEAYYLAERRGFAAGRELEDWAAAEALVESLLQPPRVA